MKIFAYGLSLFVFLSLVAPQPAHAYLDPGTGSVILQVLVAGALGAAFTIKLWWRNSLDFIKRLLGKKSDSGSSGV